MWSEFIRAVNIIKPKSFIAENVLGLLNPKFRGFVQEQILDKLPDYHILMFELNAADFGVPQMRASQNKFGTKIRQQINLERKSGSKINFVFQSGLQN